MKKVTGWLLCLVSLVVGCNSDEEEANFLPEGWKEHIIAHRGYWQTAGAVENSLASLRRAVELGVCGAEIDVWQAGDGTLVVRHDSDWEGKKIPDSTVEELRRGHLDNGEFLPLFSECLEIVASAPDFTLLVELKSADPERVADAVRQAGVADHTMFCSFSRTYCDGMIASGLGRPVFFITENTSPDLPQELAEAGYGGISYYQAVWREHPELLADARARRLRILLWTVNDRADIGAMIASGVDYICTDTPDL